MIEPSAPLVPIDDDSLLWINSGVATLKNTLMVARDAKKAKIVNSQKPFVLMILKMLALQRDIIHF